MTGHAHRPLRERGHWGLTASDDDTLLFGVCGGLGERVGIGSGWVRLAFVVVAASSWVGIALYLALALTLPTAAERGFPLRDQLQSRAQRLLAGLIEVPRRAMETLASWRAARTSDSGDQRLRGLVAGGSLLLGAFALLQSFGLLGWLTLGRAVAIALVLLGLARWRWAPTEG